MMPGRSKFGIATLLASELNENAGPYHFQSNRMYCRPWRAAKSMLALASAVVWAITRMILAGLIQLSSLIFEGSFRFRMKWSFSIRAVGVSATMMPRHGVANG